MKTHTRKKLNVAGLWTAATVVAGTLGVLCTWMADFEEKAGVSNAAVVSNVRTISALAATVEELKRGDVIIRRKLKVRSAALDTLAEIPPAQEPPGLVRRVFRLLF